MKAEFDAKGRRSLVPSGEPDVIMECDDVLVAVGQENAFPWIERDIGLEFDKWDMPKVDPATMQSTNPKVFFGGDAAFGPKNIIWAVAHGHDAAISIDLLCQGKDVGQRPPPMVNLSSQKMGIHEWSYDNDISNDQRFKVPHAPIEKTLKDVKLEVELGFDIKQAFRGSRALPELRCPDRVRHPQMHRMRCLCRYLPDGLHHLHRQWRGRAICASG